MSNIAHRRRTHTTHTPSITMGKYAILFCLDLPCAILASMPASLHSEHGPSRADLIPKL